MSMLSGPREGEEEIDGELVYHWFAQNGVSTSQSYYLAYKDTPSRFWAGHPDDIYSFSLG